MAGDISQFLQTFFEESAEGLETMEGGLLNLDPGEPDAEEVNSIFRAAHSIKGGSATFGLDDVAAFTHVLETLLDEWRDGRRTVSDEVVDLLLQSVDCLRAMLAAHQNGEAADAERTRELQQALEAVLANSGDASAGGEAQTAKAAPAVAGWRIVFTPHPDLFLSGNDTVRILRELSELGELEADPDLSALPPLEELEPEKCYLSWILELRGDASQEQLEEVFAWVEDDCDLALVPLPGGDPEEAAAEADAPPPPAPGEAAPPAPAGERSGGGDRRSSGQGDATSIRVSIDKVDAVINLVGELVITQSMLSTLGEDFDMSRINQLRDGLAQLERNTRELQENVMRMRMLPIRFAFNRFPRLVRDVSQKLGKKVELEMSGENTELDKTLIEKLTDPLVHLVRNSLDHGIEDSAEERIAAGKPETGLVSLNADHKGGNIVIEVRDDGRGLNAEKIRNKAVERGLVDPDLPLTEEQCYELILLPGFSTADTISDVSGRGVGMDVVKKNIESLGGSVEIASTPGTGSCFTVRLPLTLAILDGQSIAVGGEVYIVPLVAIIESIQVTPGIVNQVAGQGETFRMRGEYLPIIRLGDVFGAETRAQRLEEGLIVVVEGDGRRVGLFVDELLGQQQVVIKSLEANYRKVDGLSGATILGDGSVALILDVPSLVRVANQQAAEGGLRKQA